VAKTATHNIARVLGVGALVTFFVWTFYAMTHASPAWWRSRRPADPSAVQAAEEVENGLVTQFSSVRPGDPKFEPRPGQSWQSEKWSVSLSEDDANAWLNERLRRWITTRDSGVRWPEDVQEIQVEMAPGVLHVGTKVRTASGPRVLALSVRPIVASDGALWVPADGVQLGTIPLPSSLVLEWAKRTVFELFPDSSEVRADTQAVLDAFQGRSAIVRDPVVKLEGGRRVRLLGIATRDGRMDLTFRTEKK